MTKLNIILPIGLLVLCIVALLPVLAQDTDFSIRENSNEQLTEEYLDLLKQQILDPKPTSSCPMSRRERVEAYLKNITAPGEGVLFGVGKRQMGPNPEAYKTMKIFQFGQIDESDILRVGSVTKPFVGYLLLDTKVNLQRRLSSFGFPKSLYQGSSKIRIVDLLEMTSGIPEYTLYMDYDNGTWVPGVFGASNNIDLAWKERDLYFEPGSYYSYCNTGFDLIGYILQEITGETTAERMKSTFSDIAPTLQIDPGNLAPDAFPPTVSYVNHPYPHDLPGYAGSLVSTLPDLLRAFNRMVENKAVFESKMKVWNYPVGTGIWPDQPNLYTIGGVAYGRALQKYDDPVNGEMYGHEGDINVRTVVVTHPDSNSNYALHYSNYLNNPTLIRILNDLVQIYLED